MTRLYSGVGSRRSHSCSCTCIQGAALEVGRSDHTVEARYVANHSPGRNTQRERRLPPGPTCHRCGQAGLGRDVKLHPHHARGHNGSIVARRHRQRPTRPGITRPTWPTHSLVPDITNDPAQEALVTTSPVRDDVAVLYQLLFNLSLADEPAFFEEECTAATTEPESGNQSGLADEVINIVRAPRSIYRLNTTAIMAQILRLQETRDLLSLQALHPTPPSATILAQSQRRCQLLAPASAATERGAVGQTPSCLQPQMLTQVRILVSRGHPHD